MNVSSVNVSCLTEQQASHLNTPTAPAVLLQMGQLSPRGIQKYDRCITAFGNGAPAGAP